MSVTPAQVLATIDTSFMAAKQEAIDADALRTLLEVEWVHILARRQASKIADQLDAKSLTLQSAEAGSSQWLTILMGLLSALFPSGSTFAGIISTILALLGGGGAVNPNG